MFHRLYYVKKDQSEQTRTHKWTLLPIENNSLFHGRSALSVCCNVCPVFSKKKKKTLAKTFNFIQFT